MKKIGLSFFTIIMLAGIFSGCVSRVSKENSDIPVQPLKKESEIEELRSENELLKSELKKLRAIEIKSLEMKISRLSELLVGLNKKYRSKITQIDNMLEKKEKLHSMIEELKIQAGPYNDKNQKIYMDVYTFDGDVMNPSEIFIENDPYKAIEYLINLEELYFPEETRLLGIRIKDGVAYVDLNEEFYYAVNIGTRMSSFLREDINIRSIVYTLCTNISFGVNEVVFFSDGEKAELMNHSQPIKMR